MQQSASRSLLAAWLLVALALTGCEPQRHESDETADEKPKETKKPAPESDTPTANAMPWIDGVRAGGDGGVIVTGDWVSENGAANALFAGLEGCRAIRGWGGDGTVQYGLSLDSKSTSEVSKLARDRMTTLVPGATELVVIPGGPKGRDARPMVHDVELSVHIGGEPRATAEKAWQRGPLGWLAELESGLKAETGSVAIMFMGSNGVVRATARIVIPFAPETAVEHPAAAWAKTNGFGPGEGADSWTRRRGDWTDAIQIVAAEVHAIVTDIVDAPAEPSGKACNTPAAKKVGVSLGGAGVSGGGVGNAAAVVARMKGGFRACYQTGLKTDPGLQGSATLVAKIDANGAVVSVSGGTGGPLDPILGCLKSVVSSRAFAPPDNGAGAVISIPISFVQQ